MPPPPDLLPRQAEAKTIIGRRPDPADQTGHLIIPAGKLDRVMKYLFILPISLLLLGSLCSCQTTRGFGDDLSALGNRISDKASEHSD